MTSCVKDRNANLYASRIPKTLITKFDTTSAHPENFVLQHENVIMVKETLKTISVNC